MRTLHAIALAAALGLPATYVWRPGLIGIGYRPLPRSGRTGVPAARRAKRRRRNRQRQKRSARGV